MLPPRVERQAGRYRKSNLAGAETHEQRPPRRSGAGQENLSCNWITGGTVWTSLRVQTPRGPSHRAAHPPFVVPLAALPGCHKEERREISLLLQKQERKGSHFEIHRSILSILTRSALKREIILPEPNLSGFYQGLT